MLIPSIDTARAQTRIKQMWGRNCRSNNKLGGFVHDQVLALQSTWPNDQVNSPQGSLETLGMAGGVRRIEEGRLSGWGLPVNCAFEPQDAVCISTPDWPGAARSGPSNQRPTCARPAVANMAASFAALCNRGKKERRWDKGLANIELLCSPVNPIIKAVGAWMDQATLRIVCGKALATTLRAALPGRSIAWGVRVYAYVHVINIETAA